MTKVLSKEELTPGLFHLKVEASEVAQKALPGQFVILIPDERGERIPLTIADWDRERGCIDLVFAVVGRTTSKLAAIPVGERLAHIVGPLGRPSIIEKVGTVAMVAIGYAQLTLLPVARALREAGNDIIALLWASQREHVLGEEEWHKLGEVIIAAGDYSPSGDIFVLDPLYRLLTSRKIDQVRVQGPLCVMRLCSSMTQALGIRIIVSLNPVMVDGTGMCGACRVLVAGENKFACVDGPEFDGHQVDWLQLLVRRCTYLGAGNISRGNFKCPGCSTW